MDWVRDIVLNMHGQDLTALKNAMDDGGDAHNIHKLIYNDILVCASWAVYPGLLFVGVIDSMRTHIADYYIRAVTCCLMQLMLAALVGVAAAGSNCLWSCTLYTSEKAQLVEFPQNSGT